MNECKKCTHFLLHSLNYGSKWSKYFFAKHNFFFLRKKTYESSIAGCKLPLTVYYFAFEVFVLIYFFKTKK